MLVGNITQLSVKDDAPFLDISTIVWDENKHDKIIELKREITIRTRIVRHSNSELMSVLMMKSDPSSIFAEILYMR